MKTEPFSGRDWVLFIIFALISCVIGIKPLLDPDLGWHLAGGMWILQEKAVPVIDPFGIESRPWVCYSWLFEIVVAGIYSNLGFAGLQLFQFLLILVLFLIGFSFLRVLSQEGRRGSRNQLVFVLALGLFVLFTTPVWHLRPQLLSLIIFMLVVGMLESRKESLLILLGLQLIWVNIHVFWVFMPLLIGIHRVLPALAARKREEFFKGFTCAALLSICGLASPYGLENIRVIAAYAFNHRIAYDLIAEFQPLTMKLGYLWVLYFMVMAGVLLRLQRLARESSELVVVFMLFSLLALFQIKYLPYFGVVGSLLLMRCFGLGLGGQASSQGSNMVGDTTAISWSAGEKLRVGVALILFAVTLFLMIEVPAPITTRNYELRETVSEIYSKLGETTGVVPILNHFDDGGWLALWLFLGKREFRSPADFRTTVDGRTLVMGERRLDDFNRLRFQREGWCEVLAKWNPAIGVWPTESPLVRLLLGNNLANSTNCSGKWKSVRSFSVISLIEPS